MARISMERSKISLRCCSSRMRQALRRVTVSERRNAEMMPAKPFLQQERNSLMLFLRKRSDWQQVLKQSSKLFCPALASSALVICTSSLLRSVDPLMGANLNMDDSTLSMMFLISLSSLCSSRFAESRMNCSPASFFISEFTFTLDINCMIASSSSLYSISIIGYDIALSLFSPYSYLLISAAILSAALGVSIFLMKISRAIFLLLRGTSLLKISPSTDLLWNCAQNLLVICRRLQKGMYTTLPLAVTKTSPSSSLYSPMPRQRSTREGRSCSAVKLAGSLDTFSTMMQMLLADWMASRQCGCMWLIFSEMRLLQGTNVSCCICFFSIMRIVTSWPPSC